MDFRLFFRVIRRFKWIVGVGFLLACVFSFLSYVKVGPHGLRYREQEKFMSTARLLVTSKATDPSQLAITYAALATSDQVTKAAIGKHGIHGTLLAASGYVNSTSTALPTVSISGISTTPARAATLANDSISALQALVARQQTEIGVPPGKQAKLHSLNRALAAAAQVYAPRSKTPPVIVFVLVMAAAIGLAFLLENLRPRIRLVPSELSQRRTNAEQRRASRRG